MSVVLLGLLVGIILCVVASRRGSRWAQPLLALLVVAGILGVVVARFTTPTKRSSQLARMDEERAAANVLGQYLAREIHAGFVLVLRDPPIAKSGVAELSNVRFAGLLEACKGSPIELNQAGPASAETTVDGEAFTGFSGAAFEDELRQWFGKQREVKAVVSLLPLAPQFRPPNVPFYAFFAGRDTSWADGIRSGRIKAAIVYRRPPLPSDLRPEANHGLPAKFILVTKDNVDAAVKELSF